MGGAVSGVASVFGAASSAMNSGKGGSGGGGGGGGSSNQASAPQSLCGQASLLTDTNKGESNGDPDQQSVVQGGGLGSSFGSGTESNNAGRLLTTYADGGSALNQSPSLTDIYNKYKKVMCTSDMQPNFVCDKPSLLNYSHNSQQGGLSTVHKGNFGTGYDDGGKVSESNTDAVKFVPHSNFFETVGRAILPSVFKAGDQMKSSLNAPASAAKCNSSTCTKSQTQSCKPTCKPTCTPPKEFHFEKGGLSHYAAAAPKGHNPEFITGKTGYYACGKGTGQSDDIPAMLHDGDYVMDAETVSALGDGSSKAGRDVLDGFHSRLPYKADGGSAKPVAAQIADGEYVFPSAFVTALGSGDNKRGAEILDGLRERLRQHKRSAPKDKIPPKAKDPSAYIKGEK